LQEHDGYAVRVVTDSIYTWVSVAVSLLFRAMRAGG
jgi:hypothetical protein